VCFFCRKSFGSCKIAFVEVYFPALKFLFSFYRGDYSLMNDNWLNDFKKIKWRHVGAGFVVWTVVGLSFAVRAYFFYKRQGIEPNGFYLLSGYMLDFYLWALASPFIFVFSIRFLIERGRIVRNAIYHIFAGVAFTMIIVAVSIPLYWFLGLADLNRVPTLYDLFTKSIFSPMMIHEGLMAFWLTAIAAHAFEYYGQARQREMQAAEFAAQSARLSEQLVQAQLSALKMQLHPHFLFNTLNSIASLMHKDTETAHRMIVRLSDFLRITLKNSETQSVTLEKELEFLKTYLEIEKIRFQDRLTVEMNVEEAAEAAQVPNLILQPLVENAVRHGLANVSATGHLTISAQRRNGTIFIQIEDNGPGFNGNKKQKRKSGAGGGGVGLTNTRARLEQFYGGNFSFEIADKTDSSGTIVSLRLPFRTEENNG
jgi:sensor histidine kinase YesM